MYGKQCLFYPSVMVNQLMDLGIAPLATELARHSLPLGGRLQHFKSNWVRITQDPWVLKPYKAAEYLSVSSLENYSTHKHQTSTSM